MMGSWFLVVLGGALAAEPVTLDEALALAARSNPEVQVADFEAVAARARSAQVGTYFLPSVTVDGNALWWDGPLESQLLPEDPCADMNPLFQGTCQELTSGFNEPLILREAKTQQFGVTAALPLTGMVGIYEGHRATRALARAAERDAEGQQAASAVDVVEAWLGALSVRHLAEVAGRGVAALEAHEQRVGAFVDVGILGRSDLLQVQVALGETRVGLERARVGIELSDRRLALITGAEADALSPTEVDLSSLPRVGLSSDIASELAPARPEVAAMRERLIAARAGRDRAVADLVPQVAGIASWKRSWGLGEFSANEETYVGLGLQWDVMSWGRRSFALRESTFSLRQAEVGLEALSRGAVLEAEAAVREVELDALAWQTAQLATTRAEENLRIVTARHEAHTLTTAELLEAEALAFKVRADEVTTAVDFLLAVARAQQALGLPVRPLDGLVAGGDGR